MANTLTEILRAASKHPNSRVSKLIHEVEGEPTQKNIVLLLIELADHAEYSVDFNVSLKYYLELFERLGINHDLVLNEAGLLLVNSSKIYSKRVDYVQGLVERHVLTLSNADNELQQEKLEQQTENAVAVEKPKRGRKRVLEAPSDPYEIELVPKKFKRLADEKRFALTKAAPKAKPFLRNIEMEQHIHPAGWQHATIYDLENEEDVDTKRNYKLFTYHVEHRYNTLVPDINFRLHFKVKDYMDEQEEMEDEACNTDRSWPPLSEAYVQKYLRLENYVLQQDMKVNKRKSAHREESTVKQADAIVVTIDHVDDLPENLNNSNINDTVIGTKNTLSQGIAFDSLAESTASNLETSLVNKNELRLETTSLSTKNDSGLGHSLLDDTSNTLESTQLNCTLETSNNQEHLNSTLAEASKNLNITESQAEKQTVLEASVLHQADDTQKNTTESTENFTNNENIDPNIRAANNSLNVTESELADSILDKSVLNPDTTIETDENNMSANISSNPKTTQENICETTVASSEMALDITASEQKVSEQQKTLNSGKDSASSDAISTESPAITTESLNKNKATDESERNINIDADQQKDEKLTQIRVHLPNGDDEGVYLSDLEEHDCQLLSPVIKTTNILPGVERKDVTIIMDEELRQALEMRDNILKHFSYETYKVPVITEPKKQSLIFNILKLPEKLLRRKVLFKLGPEMDLYLQARTNKRFKPEPIRCLSRNGQKLQWFCLNNTDMTDVCLTSSNSSGHSPDFTGFPNNEDDDSISCVDFYGFTEEEQAMLTTKPLSRLSRDSGVGGDDNNITPDKERMEIVFEDRKISKRNINSKETQSMESILEQLPDEIREVLTTELQGNNENNCTTAIESKDNPPDVLISANDVVDSKKLDTPSSLVNSESVLTENCTLNCTLSSSENTETLTTSINAKESEECTENSMAVTTEDSSSNNTQQSNVLTENSNEAQTCTGLNAINSEPAISTESQNKSNDIDGGTSNHTISQDNDVQMACDKDSETEKPKIKIAEGILKEKLELAHVTEQRDNTEEQHRDVRIYDSEDIVLDLNSQGNKTKIQQWHEHLQPILAKSRERHHFDVYKLGTDIISTIQGNSVTVAEPLNVLNSTSSCSSQPVASFHNIMDKKDKTYVSRYFLSTLLLANQSNIEVMVHNKSSEKPSSWHDINLKLLSTKRHTVAIEDNIGMIDSKQKNREQNIKQTNSEKIQNKIIINNQQIRNEEEIEPLTKLLSMAKSSRKSKTSLKRASEKSTISSIVEKKPKEIFYTSTSTNCRQKSPIAIESVEIITPPFANAPSTVDITVMPSTSRQAEKVNTALFNVNINDIRTLQPIEKIPRITDEHDSGIFSIDEMSTS